MTQAWQDVRDYAREVLSGERDDCIRAGKLLAQVAELRADVDIVAARKQVIWIGPEVWNELWGLPHIEAFAQKCDRLFATLADPKSNPNPKKIKKDP